MRSKPSPGPMLIKGMRSLCSSLKSGENLRHRFNRHRKVAIATTHTEGLDVLLWYENGIWNYVWESQRDSAPKDALAGVLHAQICRETGARLSTWFTIGPGAQQIIDRAVLRT